MPSIWLVFCAAEGFVKYEIGTVSRNQFELRLEDNIYVARQLCKKNGIIKVVFTLRREEYINSRKDKGRERYIVFLLRITVVGAS